jgi:hypothetical protein
VTRAAAQPRHRLTPFVELKLWWLSPIAISVFVGIASILPTAFVGDQQFRTLWRSPKSVTTETLMMFGCGVLALAFGALIAVAVAPKRVGLSAAWPSLNDRTVAVLRRASTVLTALTVAGYAGFLILILRSGIGPAELLAGSSIDGTVSVRDRIGTLPGITTLTQVGIAAVVVSMIVLVRSYSRAELAKVLVVLAFAVPRAYVFTERLAILELVVPIAVIVAARMSFERGIRGTVAQLIPIGSLVSVVLVFGTFEYFRSWRFYRLHSSASFPEFALSRFAGYYATGINNGQVILDHLRWPGRIPFDTVEGFWTAPVIEQVELYEKLGGHVRPYTRGDVDSIYSAALKQFANPEFNNPSGYVGPFVDYGLAGGLLLMFAIGVVAGLLYTSFCRAKLPGLLLYPVVFTGLLELPRYLYWMQGRTAYTWVGLIVVLVVALRAQREVADDT